MDVDAMAGDGGPDAWRESFRSLPNGAFGGPPIDMVDQVIGHFLRARQNEWDGTSIRLAPDPKRRRSPDRRICLEVPRCPELSDLFAVAPKSRRAIAPN